MSQAVDQLLRGVEARRQAVSAGLPRKRRAALGQFFTPSHVADFLASLIELPSAGRFRLLDPGAGIGSLSASVVARVIREQPSLDLHVTAFEVDDGIAPHLSTSLAECVAVAREHGVSVSYDVRVQSFVDYATSWLLETPGRFDACIMNPPYRKVSTTTTERRAAETLGLRASNLYTIFVGLAADLLDAGGQLSAIIPRSFANGPYHEPFRRFLCERMSLDFMHVYERRGDVFGDADVLQENIVLKARRARQNPTITISTSPGAAYPNATRDVAAPEVLQPDDPHAFVRLPMDEWDTLVAETVNNLPATLEDLELSVSTGRVVDFRARTSLRQDPDASTVPLIYPGHLRNGRVAWPSLGGKKPNALDHNERTAGLLLPNETYVVVKRFSAKEERRRIVAAISEPPDVPGSHVAFENHLNVFHRRLRGLPRPLAKGLAGFLSSTLVDDYVRTFSGHTQINATDLRQLRYPSDAELVKLGDALTEAAWRDQALLDATVAAHVRVLSETVGQVPAAA